VHKATSKITDSLCSSKGSVLRLTRTVQTAAVTLAALGSLIAPTSYASAAEPGDTVAMPVRDALKALPVSGEDRTGYQRSKFRHWVDTDRDSCNTRQEVLLEEAVTAPEQGVSCALTRGSWYSPYDDKYFTDARALDIDHLVPLAEAWDSGAFAWSAAERQEYANDLGDSRALIAVSAASNRSKSDQDPATWQPPAVSYRCTYATGWIASKPAGASRSTLPSRARSPRSSSAARTARSRSPSPAEQGVRGSAADERAGHRAERVVCIPGEHGASVAVSLVESLVEVVRDVDDAGGELQGARVVGEQLEFGQGLTNGGARFARPLWLSEGTDAPRRNESDWESSLNQIAMQL
jgi:hypothetical protein